MLQLSQLQLKKNQIIIAAHPVEIDEKIGSVVKTEQQIKDEKAARWFRTGEVVGEGTQDREVLDMFPNKDGSARLTYLGSTVLFMAPSVNPIDVPIEGVQQPVLMNTEYLIAIIDESNSPY